MSISYSSLWENEAISYNDYRNTMADQAAAGQTSGPNQSEALIQFTALNERRMKRLDRKLKLLPDVIEDLLKIKQAQRWLVISETWCGDAAQILPVLQKMADQNDGLSMKVIWRDDYPELMDAHLTNGARAIPMLIALDEAGNLLGEWGPRPEEAQEMVMANKKLRATIADEAERAARYGEFQIALQKWYNDDKGRSVQREVMELILSLSAETNSSY